MKKKGNFWTLLESKSEVAQSCLTLCDPMDCSLPGSSIHGIFQARVLEWVAISFSRGSSWPRDRIPVSRVISRCFTVWATREVLVQGRKRKNYCSIAMSSNLLSDLLLYRRGLISWQTEVIFFLWICVISITNPPKQVEVNKILGVKRWTTMKYLKQKIQIVLFT